MRESHFQSHSTADNARKRSQAAGFPAFGNRLPTHGSISYRLHHN
jgi:hypothetical protein